VDSVDGLSADDIPDLLPSLPKSAEGKHVTVCRHARPINSCISQHHVLKHHQSVNTVLFWDVKPCSVVEEYRHFRVTYSTLKIEALFFSEMLVPVLTLASQKILHRHTHNCENPPSHNLKSPHKI
jgi:hypothetical protein